MAVNPVNLCADLQAWHSAGLSFLYFSDVDAKSLLEMPRAVLSVRAEASPWAANAPLSHAFQPGQPAVQDAQKNAAGEKSGGVPFAGSAEVPLESATTSAVEARVLDVEVKLPAAWDAILHKVKPAPVIWTYLELGEDLLVKGNPERSRALRELIGVLGLKGGTNAFLPVVLPGCAQDGSEAWCFGSVLGRLNGRILVSFGADALALGPYAYLQLEPFHEKIVQGHMVLCLPSFAEILSNPVRFEATKVFLRSAFAKINIL